MDSAVEGASIDKEVLHRMAREARLVVPESEENQTLDELNSMLKFIGHCQEFNGSEQEDEEYVTQYMETIRNIGHGQRTKQNMSNATDCPTCGATSVYVDNARNSKTCESCGWTEHSTASVEGTSLVRHASSSFHGFYVSPQVK